jgi:hypothetical protein
MPVFNVQGSKTCESRCKGWVHAICDIPAGSELFVEYGEKYWK